MFEFIKKYSKKSEKKEKMIKIVDIGHYGSLNYGGGEVREIIRVLGASQQHEGMWVLEEKDARGINKLISEHALLSSYEPIVIQPQYTDGKIKQLPNHLLVGILDEFEETPEIIEPTHIIQENNVVLTDYEKKMQEIKGALVSPVKHTESKQIEPQYRVSESQQFVNNIEDENIFLHKKVIEKFILPNNQIQKNLFTFELSANVDIPKLVDAMDLMSLNPETVLEILLQNSDFKNSLVQIFGGKTIKKTDVEELSPKFAPYILVNDNNIIGSESIPKIPVDSKFQITNVEEFEPTKVIQVTGENNFQDVVNSTNVEIKDLDSHPSFKDAVMSTKPVVNKSPWQKMNETLSNTILEPNHEDVSNNKIDTDTQPNVEEIVVDNGKFTTETGMQPMKKSFIRNPTTISTEKEKMEETIDKFKEINQVDVEPEAIKNLMSRIGDFNNKTKINLD